MFIYLFIITINKELYPSLVYQFTIAIIETGIVINCINVL